MVRVRFAPSPTGNLHIGSLRTAIFNWLYARHSGGKYLLRIEDTDRIRSTKEFEDSQLKSLKWFNLIPDEPILRQFNNVDKHRKIAIDLMMQGLAYPCFCQPEDVAKKVTELSSGVGHKYPGVCRGKKWVEADLKRPYAVRINIPDDLKEVSFNDLIRGKISVSTDQLDDFVILRRDGTPTYNFSVVLDDVEMKISHVIRGEDHISNTPKQIIIYNAIKKEKPFFAHLPLILGASGNKLSKRDAAVSVEEYKKQGFLADALFNYLVRLGWSHGDQEVFSRDDLVRLFSIGDVGKKGAIFDLKKLEWLNSIYLKKLNYSQLLHAIDDLGAEYRKLLLSRWSERQLKKLLDLYVQRSDTLLPIIQNILSLSNIPAVLDLSLITKWKNEKTVDLLKDFINRLNLLKHVDHEQLLKMSKDICSKFDVKLVSLAQPIRLALTGSICSPGVFELVEVLGVQEAEKRINLLINELQK